MSQPKCPEFPRWVGILLNPALSYRLIAFPNSGSDSRYNCLYPNSLAESKVFSISCHPTPLPLDHRCKIEFYKFCTSFRQSGCRIDTTSANYHSVFFSYPILCTGNTKKVKQIVGCRIKIYCSRTGNIKFPEYTPYEICDLPVVFFSIDR